MQGVGDGSGGCQRSPQYGEKDLREAGSRQGRDDSEGRAPKTRQEKFRKKETVACSISQCSGYGRTPEDKPPEVTGDHRERGKERNEMRR